MDIFPSAVNTIINHQGVTALSEKIQNLEYIDLAEKAIKALERISSESANSVLNNASLDIILNMMDFFEMDVQICILKMISNVSLIFIEYTQIVYGQFSLCYTLSWYVL